MISKSEHYINVVGCLFLVALCYWMLYLSPNLESLKIIIPLICFFAGWKFLDSFNELDELDKMERERERKMEKRKRKK